MGKRQTFTQAFNVEAVRLFERREKPAAEVVRERPPEWWRSLHLVFSSATGLPSCT